MVEKSNISISQSRKDIKKRAKGILADHNIRLKLILASLICVAAFMLTEIIKNSFFYALSYSMTAIQAEHFRFFLDIAFSISRLLILSPLFIGYFSFSAKLAAGTEPNYQDLFVFYSTPQKIFKTWVIGAVVILPQNLLTALVLIIPDIFEKLLNNAANPDIAYLFILIPIILEVGVFFLSILCLRLYTVINAYICGGDQSLRSCISAALYSTRKNCFKIFAFIVSFIPWILLSFCTVGVLFLIFTIPYMAISYNLYSSELITKTFDTTSKIGGNIK